MASTLQAVFALPSFQNRYVNPTTASTHALTCTEPTPATCIECQMLKMADGLQSGRYSVPRARPDVKSDHSQFQSPTQDEEPTPVFQEGIKPTMFKALIGKGHPEFSTMKQQDSEEFFTHFLKVLRQDHKKHASAGTGGVDDATGVFRYGIEQRLQCMDCQRVSYRVDPQDVVSVPVPTQKKNGGAKNEAGKVEYEDVQLESCLDMLTSGESLEYKCPSCNRNVIANKYVTCYLHSTDRFVIL
jgi:ubiquitin carboxyl-terminal hydrolase 5/13